MSHDSATDREKLYKLIEEIRIAMFTTIERDGSLHSRPMGKREADAQGNIWFFADRTESIVRNISDNPEVSLGFSDPHGNNYVAVSGIASLVDDRALIREKWTDYMKAWFPAGQDDPKIILIKVDPLRGEFWDFGASFLTHIVGFVKAKITGEPANDLGETKQMLL